MNLFLAWKILTILALFYFQEEDTKCPLMLNIRQIP